MYFEEEILLEDNSSTSCFACVSSNRSLFPLGDYSELFSKFFDYSCMPDLHPISLCWECMAILRKVKIFKQKVDHAQSILNYHFADPDKPKCLSNLKTTNIHITSIEATQGTSWLNTEININQNVAKVKEEQIDDNHTVGYSCKADEIITFLNKEEFAKHHPQCDNCGLKFESKQDLEEHALTHTQLLCKICKKSFENYDLYKQHVSVDHLKTDTPVTVEVPAEDPSWDMEPIESDQESESEWEKSLAERMKSGDKKNLKVVDNSCKSPSYIKIEVDNPKSTRPRISRKREYFRHHHKIVTAITKKVTVSMIPVDISEVRLWMDKDKESEIFKRFKLKCGKCVRKIDCAKSHKQFHDMKNSDALLYFVCKICELIFKTVESRQKHVTLCHTSLFQCSECGFKCHLPEVMEFHIWQHNRKVQCLSCNAVFESQEEFCQHGPKCDHCGLKFKSVPRLENHVKVHHISHLCKICNKWFKTRARYRHHKLIKHPNPKAAVSRDDSYCVTCDKHFMSPLCYIRHINHSLAHDVERGKPLAARRRKRVKCTACSKSFSRSTFLERHYEAAHSKEYFRCEHCGKVLLSKSSLRRHVQVIHEGVKVKIPKNQICTICGRAFRDNRILRNHVRTHTGERPHECPHCNWAFAQRSALVEHIKRIHGVIPDVTLLKKD